MILAPCTIILGMTYDAPLALYETDVLPDWIDLNGHLNVAYYMRAFDLATDAFFDVLGMGWDYAEREGHSLFALETHLNYLGEVREGAHLRFHTRLLDYDAKRVHFFHEMFHAGEGYKAATSEWLAIHVDAAARRSAALPDFALERLASIMSAHEALPRPDEAGHVGIKRRAG